MMPADRDRDLWQASAPTWRGHNRKPFAAAHGRRQRNKRARSRSRQRLREVLR